MIRVAPLGVSQDADILCPLTGHCHLLIPMTYILKKYEVLILLPIQLLWEETHKEKCVSWHAQQPMVRHLKNSAVAIDPTASRVHSLVWTSSSSISFHQVFSCFRFAHSPIHSLQSVKNIELNQPFLPTLIQDAPSTSCQPWLRLQPHSDTCL